MAGYQFEKIEIEFILSFYLLKNLIQLHYPDKDIQDLNKLSYLIQTVLLLKDLFSREKH